MTAFGFNEYLRFYGENETNPEAKDNHIIWSNMNSIRSTLSMLFLFFIVLLIWVKPFSKKFTEDGTQSSEHNVKMEMKIHYTYFYVRFTFWPFTGNVKRILSLSLFSTVTVNWVKEMWKKEPNFDQIPT